jgi:DNA repair protein RadD
MLVLRDYQRDAVDALFDYFKTNNGYPCLVAPTSAGKSLIQGTFIKEVATGWPTTRVLCLTHVKELVEQNYLEFLGVYPDADVGVYNAAMKRRDTENNIIFVSIQSVYKKAYELGGAFNVLIIDECHLCPVRTSGGMYRTFIDALLKINPDLKIIGLSATPWRLDDGLLNEGKNRLFTDLIELPNMTMSALLQAGYLTPLTTPPTGTATKIDTTGIKKRAGDFVKKDLDAAIEKQNITQAACNEIISFGAERKSWLLFAASVKHAEALKIELRRQLISCEVVTGDTPKIERDAIVELFKTQRLRCLINVNVFTTGFNARCVDLIGFLRPTESASLYVQMCGRGMRLSPETGKTDCLVLDFAGLIDTHGPVDKVKGKSKAEKKEGGESPVKECPDCLKLLHTSLMKCPFCGYEYPMTNRDPHGDEVSTSEVISGSRPFKTVDVTRVLFAEHNKEGKPPSMRVTYFNGMKRICSEYVCFEHGGFATRKAHQWWSLHTGLIDVPETTAEALDYSNTTGFRIPTRLTMMSSGKYPDIMGKDFEQHEC